MSVFVCLSVCLCVCLSAIISSELHMRSSPGFLCILIINTKNCSLSIVLTATNQKPQKIIKKVILPTITLYITMYLRLLPVASLLILGYDATASSNNSYCYVTTHRDYLLIESSSIHTNLLTRVVAHTVPNAYALFLHFCKKTCPILTNFGNILQMCFT